MKFEPAVAARFIRDRVRDALDTAGLTTWPVEPEPYDRALPGVTFRLLATRDAGVTLNGQRTHTELVYLVEALVPGKTLGATNALVAQAAIDDALHGVKASNADGLIFGSHRERPSLIPPQNIDQPVTRVGGIYRLEVRGNP